MTDKINLNRIICSQIKSKSLFEQAKSYAYDYMETVNQRSVYPSDTVLEKLSVFDEPFPEAMGDGEQILQLLHEYGSPATVAQTGNRYFGFINGGVTPGPQHQRISHFLQRRLLKHEDRPWQSCRDLSAFCEL